MSRSDNLSGSVAVFCLNNRVKLHASFSSSPWCQSSASCHNKIIHVNIVNIISNLLSSQDVASTKEAY